MAIVACAGLQSERSSLMARKILLSAIRVAGDAPAACSSTEHPCRRNAKRESAFEALPFGCSTCADLLYIPTAVPARHAHCLRPSHTLAPRTVPHSPASGHPRTRDNARSTMGMPGVAYDGRWAPSCCRRRRRQSLGSQDCMFTVRTPSN